MIDVLVVDDSAVVREYFAHLFGAQGDMRVVGTAKNGVEALQMVETLHPHVITMDISMPVMSGEEASRRIMAEHPTPIVVVSAQHDQEQVKLAFKAMEAGALAIVQKPYGAGHPQYGASVRELVDKVRLMAGVKVVRRWTLSHPETIAPPRCEPARTVRIVAIGASTGGPQAIQSVLRSFPAVFRAPVLIVQHITVGFCRGFADWLRSTTGVSVRLPEDGEELRPGVAYLAPDDQHMGVTKVGTIRLDDSEPLYGVRPSVGYLFRSLARHYGAEAIGVIMTGMGRDGAAELKLMRDAGAVTVGQNEDSCVVYGMPGVAAKLGAVTHQLPLADIGPSIRRQLHAGTGATSFDRSPSIPFLQSEGNK